MLVAECATYRLEKLEQVLIPILELEITLRVSGSVCRG